MRGDERGADRSRSIRPASTRKRDAWFSPGREPAPRPCIGDRFARRSSGRAMVWKRTCGGNLSPLCTRRRSSGGCRPYPARLTQSGGRATASRSRCPSQGRLLPGLRAAPSGVAFFVPAPGPSGGAALRLQPGSIRRMQPFARWRCRGQRDRRPPASAPCGRRHPPPSTRRPSSPGPRRHDEEEVEWTSAESGDDGLSSRGPRDRLPRRSHTGSGM